VGDKIICLTNYWEDLSDKEQDPLVNGTLGWITECYKYYNHGLGIDVLNISMETELGDTYSGLTIDYKLLTQNESGLSKQDFIRLSKNPSTKALIPKEFAYGYAITTWKAQGSEWDNILLFEESFPWKTEDHRRYLYTGITRASEKIVVVKK